MAGPEKLTVSELTALIQRTLEGNFGSLCVEGELSNCRPSSTGHLYFTLKDSGAAISGVMFKNRLRFLNFEPRDGMLLRVRGNLSVYALRGTYQIVCEEMEQAGAGDLLLMLEKRKRLLAAEGLFDEERKKPVPRFPGTVGIISSPTGAALRDILNILERRAAGIRIIILPSPVQGEGAAELLARRIEQANAWRLADVLILGRGGGSLEDLLPFSDEGLVRAVAASELPVISAVGHEIDWALSDFAADLRAPTPSAAAELVSESRNEALGYVKNLGYVLESALRSHIERTRLLIKPFSVEDLEYRFRSILQPTLVRFDDAREALLTALAGRCDELGQRVALAKASLEAASPLAVMERGFSVVTLEKDGSVLKDGDRVQGGDALLIRPRRGMVRVRAETAD
jgi:exodeoxyribonuclease VII large subunit